MASFTTIRRQLERLRNRTNEAALSGYEEPGGATLADVGDELGRFVQVPPTPGAFEVLKSEDLLQDVLQATSSVDVEKWRVLTTLITYNPASIGAILNLVPEGLADGTFRSIAVIDPTPTVANVFGVLPPFISRTVAPALLRTIAATTGFAFSFLLQWDVSMYQAFRLQYSEVTPADFGTIEVKFTVSQ